jgi:8-oxo-dGTP diphosphatase
MVAPSSGRDHGGRTLSRVIEAAGGIVWRRTSEGGPEVLLVHRPRYDDWTLPKGKLEPGESAEAGARREVLEETGFECRLGAEVTSTAYDDRHGRPKRVRYWTMEVVRGSFQPNDEVDEIRWLPGHEAIERLSYPRDAALLASLPLRAAT